MGRFIEKVGAIATFTLETQVVQYARLAKEVTPSADGKSYYINTDDLKHLQSVNDYFDVAMLDEGERMLHFMAALPDSAHSPLYIRSGRDNESDLTQSFEVQDRALSSSLILTRFLLHRPALLLPLHPLSRSESYSVSWVFLSRGFVPYLVSRPSRIDNKKKRKQGVPSRDDNLCCCHPYATVLPIGSWTWSCETDLPR
ncbi:hypothetical protein PsorP6_003939 [Peronosclerospora sorghi]|uniref:Uncharacterized protein n=1 Tax=Peronosclerospora sorghi TaxID=230839 RepID=A0ACC0VLM4_9STRA|nr:hypothetical protein PsorP6_003939 [Peronosclerospora sorghi]